MHVECVCEAFSLEFGAGCILCYILHQTASKYKFSPRCARVLFFIHPAPARGGPSAFSENLIFPLRHIFVLHTRRPETVVSQRQNVNFQMGFGRASFSDTALHGPGARPSQGHGHWEATCKSLRFRLCLSVCLSVHTCLLSASFLLLFPSLSLSHCPSPSLLMLSFPWGALSK